MKKLSILLFRLTQNSHPGRHFTSSFLGLRSNLETENECLTKPCTIEIISKKDNIEHSIYSVQILNDSTNKNQIVAKDQNHQHTILIFQNKELNKVLKPDNLPDELYDKFWEGKKPTIVNYSVLSDIFSYKKNKDLIAKDKELKRGGYSQQYPFLPLINSNMNNSEQNDKILGQVSDFKGKKNLKLSDNRIKIRNQLKKQKSVLKIKLGLPRLFKKHQPHEQTKYLIKNNSSPQILSNTKGKLLEKTKIFPFNDNIKKQNLVLPKLNESRKRPEETKINKEGEQDKEDDKETVYSLPLIQQNKNKKLKQKNQNQNYLVNSF